MDEPPTAGRAPSGTAQQPRCAAHPEVDATGTCARCGNYVCDDCTHRGTFDHCPSCRERLGIWQFPLRRDDWSISEVLNYGWSAFSRHWLLLCGATVLLYGIVFAVSMFFGVLELALVDFPGAANVVSITGSVIQNVLQGVLQLGMFAMCFEAFGGGQVRFLTLFSQWRKAGKIILQLLAIIVVVLPVLGGLGGIAYLVFQQYGQTALVVTLVVMGVVLLVPWVYIGLGLFFMQYELAFDDAVGPIEAIVRSWKLARGQRWYLLAVSVVLIALILAGVLMCCVGLVAADPLAKLVTCATFLALRNGSELPAPVRSEGPRAF